MGGEFLPWSGDGNDDPLHEWEEYQAQRDREIAESLQPLYGQGCVLVDRVGTITDILIERFEELGIRLAIIGDYHLHNDEMFRQLVADYVLVHAQNAGDLVRVRELFEQGGKIGVITRGGGAILPDHYELQEQLRGKGVYMSDKPYEYPRYPGAAWLFRGLYDWHAV